MGTQRSDETKTEDFSKEIFEENIWTHKGKRRNVKNQNQ
jgi:hypothetical protein